MAAAHRKVREERPVRQCALRVARLVPERIEARRREAHHLDAARRHYVVAALGHQQSAILGIRVRELLREVARELRRHHVDLLLRCVRRHEALRDQHREWPDAAGASLEAQLGVVRHANADPHEWRLRQPPAAAARAR
eukprot:scaffold14703_cov50-Phaeocystis_antarctica.AAC.4